MTASPDARARTSRCRVVGLGDGPPVAGAGRRRPRAGDVAKPLATDAASTRPTVRPFLLRRPLPRPARRPARARSRRWRSDSFVDARRSTSAIVVAGYDWGGRGVRAWRCGRSAFAASSRSRCRTCPRRRWSAISRRSTPTGIARFFTTERGRRTLRTIDAGCCHRWRTRAGLGLHGCAAWCAARAWTATIVAAVTAHSYVAVCELDPRTRWCRRALRRAADRVCRRSLHGGADDAAATLPSATEARSRASRAATRASCCRGSGPLPTPRGAVAAAIPVAGAGGAARSAST